jgi:hypothetical protein
MAYLVHLFKEGKGLTKLVPPAEVEAYTNEYKEESDGIAKFMAEYVHAPETPRGDEPEEGVHWSTIQVAFAQWKREMGESRGAVSELRKRVESQYGALPKGSATGWTNFQFGTR